MEFFVEGGVGGQRAEGVAVGQARQGGVGIAVGGGTRELEVFDTAHEDVIVCTLGGVPGHAVVTGSVSGVCISFGFVHLVQTVFEL